jgi:SAM-dependent methyltransferase
MEALTAADPRSVGEYRLLGRLGSGGMGLVFLAASPAGRMVAVKVIRPELAEDPKFIRRFRDEVDAARRVSGFYTAPVVAAGTDDAQPWLATAFVPGLSLDDVLTIHGPLPIPALRRLAAGLAEALCAIHSAGLVHRDLKPANVLLASDGPRVIDFGIARAFADARLTTTGSVIGTPSFMSPEQVEGQPAGPASDMFSFGSVLAFAASGAPPFSAGPDGSRTSAMYRIVHGEPDLAGATGGIRELITACLAKDPELRPGAGQVGAYCATPAGQSGPSTAAFWPSGVARVIAAQQAALGEQLRALQAGARFPASPPARGGRPVTTLRPGPELTAPGPATAPAAGSGIVVNGSVSGFDPTRPRAARTYDYFLGGKNHFAADREVADKILAGWPAIRTGVRENRKFLARAVRYLAGEAGIRQFLDIGTGLPTADNVHEVAQAVAPSARVVYCDNDPQVLARARALLTSSPQGRTAYIHADLRDPAGILNDPVTRDVLDFSQPVALMLIAVLHMIPDREKPAETVATLLDALPSGSYIVASHITAEHNVAAAGGERTFQQADMSAQWRDADVFARLAFSGLDLVPPGVVLVSEWRNDDRGPRLTPADVSAYGGVARKR